MFLFCGYYLFSFR